MLRLLQRHLSSLRLFVRELTTEAEVVRVKSCVDCPFSDFVQDYDQYAGKGPEWHCTLHERDIPHPEVPPKWCPLKHLPVYVTADDV